MLALGCEYLGIENGHVKRIDPTQGVHYVIASVGDPSDFIHVGDVHDHATTFCRRAVERDSPLAISHAAEQGWRDDPAYEAHGLECYLGTAITVGAKRFGTLCFVSRQPRAAAFSVEECTFVELLANIIGAELATHWHLETLTELDKHLAVLHRVPPQTPPNQSQRLTSSVLVVILVVMLVASLCLIRRGEPVPHALSLGWR